MHAKKLYRQFLAHCDNGFVALDSDSYITDVNNAVCELTNRTEDELIGTGIEILFDEFCVEKIQSIYNAYECNEICHRIPGDLLQKKGLPRSAEILVNCSNNEHWLLIKNKSFRIEMENKLRQSEQMLASTLESLPFDFWINDSDNCTYLQNSYSKALWGDMTGCLPQEVGADDETKKYWIETIERAFNGEVVSGEIEYVLDGRKKTFRNIVAPIKDEEKLFGVLGMNIDITDLKEALEMRDMLLKEVHHRVKNNLQMISSIINLESINVKDEEEQALLNDLISRIDAVSLIHEKLFVTDSNIVHSADYIQDLVDHIISGVDIEGIRVDYDLVDIELGLDIIIILGLIVNELVTNSVKYAFNEPGKHFLGVSFKRLNGDVAVVVRDSGPGPNEEIVKKHGNTLGFRMIDVFTEQLCGTLVREHGVEGFTSTLRFPLKKAEA